MGHTTNRPLQDPRKKHMSEAEREAHRQTVEHDGGWFLHLRLERQRREQADRDSDTGGNTNRAK